MGKILEVAPVPALTGRMLGGVRLTVWGSHKIS
jgi:hypothetical protein